MTWQDICRRRENHKEREARGTSILGALARERGIQIQATKEGRGGISLWLIIYRSREVIKRCTRMRTRGAHIEGGRDW